MRTHFYTYTSRALNNAYILLVLLLTENKSSICTIEGILFPDMLTVMQSANTLQDKIRSKKTKILRKAALKTLIKVLLKIEL